MIPIIMVWLLLYDQVDKVLVRETTSPLTVLTKLPFIAFERVKILSSDFQTTEVSKFWMVD